MRYVGRGLAIAIAGLAVGGFLAAGSVSALAANDVPYTDQSAVGAIGLCDQTGQPLSHGSIYDKPFIGKAVDATAAQPPYNGANALATLYAYQPRSGVDPQQWSGAQLSAASNYTTPAHPTAIMTGLDESLSAFLFAYPPRWDGLVQLRIYLSAPNQPLSNTTYDAANIKVTGDTWSVVGGDPGLCGSGSAVSREEILATSSAIAASISAHTVLPTSNPTKASSTGTHGGQSAGSTLNGAAGATGATSQAPDGAASPPATVPATESAPPASAGATAAPAGSSSDTLLLLLVGVGVVGVGFVGIQWLRSR